MHVDAVDNGVVKIVLINERKTILLVFFLDYKGGRVHTNLEDGGLLYGENNPTKTTCGPTRPSSTRCSVTALQN